MFSSKAGGFNMFLTFQLNNNFILQHNYIPKTDVLCLNSFLRQNGVIITLASWFIE